MDSKFQPPMTLFERYDLRSDIGTEGCLGMGGFGSVWAYWDNEESRTVAVKVLPEIIYESQWDDLVHKFDNLKARIGEEQGQGIVRIYDLKRDGNRPYMIMEYIDGKNLEEIRQNWPKKRFEWSYIKPILLQIATALDHVHAINIVHCDVKPANIMLDSECTHAKLLDFDISQEIQNSIYRTRTQSQKEEGGAIVGSYPYMAPEQWYNNQSKYSDQYSLACIVFECLEGEAAFSCPRNEFNTFQYWQALHAQDFEKKAERLGPRANAVLRKALDKVQTQRFGSCVEFITAFDEAYAYDLKHGNEPEDPPTIIVKPTSHPHDVRNILIFLGIIAVIGFVVYRIMFPPILQPWQEIEKQWTKMLPELKHTQWPVEPVVENMKLLLQNCKKYQNRPPFLKEFQKEAEWLLGQMQKIVERHKEIQEDLKWSKEGLRAEENCPEEWGRANEQVEEAREAVENAMKAEDNNMAATYYATAMGKWDECKQTLGELESQCNVLKDKNDRIIEELKVARQSFERLDIKDFISDEWEAFLKEYDSKSNLEKSFDSLRKRDYYKRSIEICEYLGGKLDLMKFNSIPHVKSLLESVDKDAHAAQSRARENLAQLEFPDEMNTLGERMAKQDDEMEKWNQQFQGLQPSDVQSKSINELLTNYKTIKNAYDEIKQDYEDIDRKTTEQRKELDAVYASLKKTYNNLFNDKEIRTVVKTEELDALQQRLTEIDESKNKRNAAGLIIDIQNLNSDCVDLQKKGNINKQLLRQAEISYKAWMDNKALLEKFQEQWKPETNALMKEGKQAEEKYKELCRDFEFEKARELADGWLKKFDEASQELLEVIQKKAGELKDEALKMIEELKTVVTPDDDHVDITVYNESYKNGLEAWGNKDYLQAYKLFANIKEKLPALIHQLKTAHYAKDCEALKTKKDWSGLGKCAREWLDYDPDSQEAKDFQKMSHDMITQQHRDKCVECWNRKDAIGLKICAEQWLEFDPDSQDAQDFLKKAEEIMVTIRQFNETCEKYQKQKDVDSLRKCVKQWLEYDPDSQAAQDFLAKADEIEKTIQQFRDDCMDCQKRKDAAKLEETANKWLEYKSDSQEAQDFLKISHDMTIQQFREKCVACQKQKDAVNLKKIAEEWLKFDQESQEAQDFLKVSHDMTIEAYKEKCLAYKNQEEWSQLNDCAEEWLQFEGDSREAVQYRDLAQKELKNLQYISDFKEANNKGDLKTMEDLLRSWRQVAAEKPMFKKADSLYKSLGKLSNSVTARNWKEAFALSLEILQEDDFPDYGKDCGFAKTSLDTSIVEILAGAENAAKQTAEHPYREQFNAWDRLESEAGDILKKLPDNPEAIKYREIAQNGKTTLRQHVVDDCRIVLRDEKSYDTLQAKIKSNLSFLEEKYKKDDAIGRLSQIQTQCEKLQKSLRELVGKKEEEITDKLIDDVMKGADGILEMTKENLSSQTCAFADECKRIARSKQRKRINLPNGQELVLLPVRGANGVVLFWMGECEISREQYASLLESDTQNKLLKNLPFNSWFKVSSKKMRTFIKEMRMPTNESDDGNLPIRSVTWDEAFAWCEMLNIYIRMNRGQFKEKDNVLRLPTVGEWQMACGSVVPLTNDVLHQIRTTAPNKQGFYDMLGNVSEWTIDTIVSGKHLYAPPQGYSQQSNIARLPRIHIGRSWQQNAEQSESYIFAAKADFIVAGKGQGAEVKEKKIRTISGDISPEIGFRVIWAKPLPSK